MAQANRPKFDPPMPDARFWIQERSFRLASTTWRSVVRTGHERLGQKKPATRRSCKSCYLELFDQTFFLPGEGAQNRCNNASSCQRSNPINIALRHKFDEIHADDSGF